jgi:hypothetical protein
VVVVVVVVEETLDDVADVVVVTLPILPEVADPNFGLVAPPVGTVNQARAAKAIRAATDVDRRSQMEARRAQKRSC